MNNISELLVELVESARIKNEYDKLFESIPKKYLIEGHKYALYEGQLIDVTLLLGIK